MSARRPDPEVVLSLAVLLRDRHCGQERAAKATQLLGELASAGFERLAHRRIGEAVRELRRRRESIASNSRHGYWYEPSPLLYRAATRPELVGRVRALVDDLKYVDSTLADALNRALELGGAQ